MVCNVWHSRHLRHSRHSIYWSIQALKRQRHSSPVPSSSPLGGRTPTRQDSESSLPPSSPLAPFSDTDDGLDDRDGVADAEGADEDAEGEDLFGETLPECVIMFFLLVQKGTR